MKTVFALILFCLALVAGGSTVSATPIPSPPEVAAKSYVLLAADSNDWLVSVNADEPMEPASLTKIMTAYVIYSELAAGHIALDDLVLISERAWRMQGSRMFVEAGSRVSVRELLHGVVIQSGNDASVALAEYIAGTETAFADLMNAKARALGMSQSHFVNATGWPHPEHFVTAKDIALLSQALVRDYSEHYQVYAEREYTYNNIHQYNRNRLLWQDATVDGIKTGHTEAAGYCLAASAKRDGMRLISVILGTDSDKARTDASLALLNYGFRFFEIHRLYSAGNILSRARVWGGAETEVPLGLTKDLYVTIGRGLYDQLVADTSLLPPHDAPIEQGTELGQLKISLQDQVIRTAPLVTLEPMPKGGLWRQLVDFALQLIRFD